MTVKYTDQSENSYWCVLITYWFLDNMNSDMTSSEMLLDVSDHPRIFFKKIQHTSDFN
jgi:hypothetical protein